MKVLWILVRRELLESARQRWLLVTLTSVLGLICAGALVLLSFTDGLAASPSRQEDLVYWTDVLGMPLADPVATLASTTVFMLQALIFNQLMSMTAVMAGHAGLHDRQCGTLPFLLLAPVGRFQLLLGKVLGALGVPLLVYLAVGGAASVMASWFACTAPSAGLLPPSGGWLATFFLGAPLWSLFTGTLCVLVSSVARDVRTAQQASWAVVFVTTFVLSPLLVGMMDLGAAVQAAFALVGLVSALAALGAGALVIGRDLAR